MKQFEVIIIGAGPAGIFAALTLVDSGVKPILIVEQGNDINLRQRREGRDILCGWGGAGAYSDGKLTLSSEVGGFLGDCIPHLLDQPPPELCDSLSVFEGYHRDVGSPG